MNDVHDNERRPNESYPIPSLHRAFVILEILSEAETSLGVSELARRTTWPKSSIFNILTTLVQDGYVAQDAENGRYRLTIKLFSLGGSVVERMDVRRLAYSFLVELTEQTGETANLGILDGTEAIYLETISGPSPIHVSTYPGKRLPLHRTALGKALIAGLPEPELEALITKTGLAKGTPNTHSSLSALQADLALTRTRGYAVDNEEDELGMRCIGAPICDHRGKTIAAVSVTGLAYRMQMDVIATVAERVMNIAQRISQQLGYKAIVPSPLQPSATLVKSARTSSRV